MPAAPTALAATALSSSQIQLSWKDNASSETGFKIEQAISATGTFTQVATVGAGVTNYTVTGLAASRTYYFRVRAYNNKGNSAYSNTANATTLPAVVTCTYTLSPSSASFDSSGITGNFQVGTGTNCSWTASSGASWLSIIAGASGTGPGVVSFSVDPNLSSSTTRSSTITIGGQSFAVSQSGVPCSYGLSPASLSHGSGAEAGCFQISTLAGCSWASTTADSWVHTAATGAGNGTVSYTIDSNSSTNSRTGSIAVGGQSFSISQAGATPVISLGEAVDQPGLVWTTGGDANWVVESAVSMTGGSAAQSGVISDGQSSWIETSVTGPANVSFFWKVSSEPFNDLLHFSIDGVEQTNISGIVDWQQLSTALGSGMHSLRWTYSKDPICCSGGQDMGWLDSVQVSAISCTYALNPTSLSHMAAPDSGSFSMTAADGCSWVASTAATWVHTSSTGSGNGTINYTVDTNSSITARGATISVGGQTFTVNQAGTLCDFVLSPTSLNHSSLAGNGSFGVMATCSWTATTAATWVHTTSAGSGNGTINYTVDANTSITPRSAAISVGGQTFTVNQAGMACTYALSPTSLNHSSLAENGSFGVTTPNGCSWAAGTDATWVHTTSSGSGSGTVTYSVDANTSLSPRSAIIAVADQVFTVNQAGLVCSYVLNPPALSHTAAAGSGSFGVTAPAGCSWTAGSAATWVHTTSAGSGNGTVSYTVDANSGSTSRTATISVGGQNFTVSQAGLTCSYALNPTSLSHTPAAESGSFGMTAPAGCSWTASTAATWVHTTSAGSGNGTINYTVDANTSIIARSANISVGGQNFTVNQAGITCTYALSPTSLSHTAAAESGSFGMTAPAGCSWTASTAATWVHTTSAGSGNGTINYTVDANTSITARSANISVGGQNFTVNQAGITCTYALSPTSVNQSAAAGSGSFGMTAPAGCSWTASTASTWVHTTSAGSGNGTINYTVDANTTITARSATISAGGQNFTVNQAGIPCTYALSPTSLSHTAAAESGSFGMTAPAGCSWTASTAATWVHTTSAGSGNGTINYTVDANTSITARSANISVGGQNFTVNQAGITCTYALNPTSVNQPAAAGSGSFGMTAPAGCAWTASTASTWVHTTSSGSGNGTINYTVDANTTITARSATISAGGQNFTVNQAGIPCTYALSPTSLSHTAAAESGSFGMTAPAGCSWTASTAATWVHTTSAGSGNGTINYTVDANTSITARSANISVGGQNFTVNQAGITCTYALSPTSLSHTAAAESGSFGMTAPAGCSWTASTAATWVHTTSAGSGNGTINYTVDANTSISARSATISVGGQNFTVNQAGVTCTYALNPASVNQSAAAGSGSFGMTAPAGCSWTASTASTWVHTTSTGSGNGTINYTVDANTTITSRSATISVGGQNFTVNQAGIPCTYALSPTSLNHTAAAESGSFGMTAPAGCSWTASTAATWVHTTSAGSGNGTINYTVDANTSITARSANISVGGQNFGVNQAGVPCTYTLSSTSASLTSAGGAWSVSVTAPAGCSWTATTATSWLHTTSSGSGSGTVNYTADANTSTSLRSGTISVGGQTFTVNESGVSCSYSLSSSGVSYDFTGGSGNVGVAAAAGCSWTATSDSAWLVVTSGGSGNGNGTFYYGVVSNSSTSARSGTITAGGQTFSVGQSGFTCTYSCSPTSISVGSAGGPGSVSVTAPPGCAWTASSALSWVTITGGASGSGNGAVSYSVTANTATSSRSGSITIAGQSVSVSQSAAGGIDSTAPTITVVTPASGSVVSNQIQIIANASDNVGVTSVQFYVDNLGSWVLIGTQSGVGPGPANYTLNYNTTNMANGGHNVLCRAYDAAGNSSYAFNSISVSNFNTDPGNLILAKDAGQSPLTGEAQHTAARGDSQGNMIVIGKFQGTINYAGTSLTSAGGYDFFIAKFTPGGALSWVRAYGGAYDNIASSVAVDGNDNIIITGQYVGSMNLGGGILTSGGGNNNPDLFVAKFNSSGAHLWSKGFGGAYGNYANGVAVDRNNDIFVTGDYNYQADFGGGAVQSAGGGDGFLVKFSGATGAYTWAKSFGGNAYDDAEALAVDGNGDVWVSGFSTGSMDFGNGSQANGGGSDAFLAKFSGSTGTTIWGKMVGGAGNEDGSGLSVDVSGNGYLVGSFSQSLTIGSVTLSAPQSAAMFIAKYDPSGTLTWAKAIGGQSSIGGNVSPRAAAADSVGNIIATGTVTGEADFGNGQISAGTGDIFVAKYSAGGGYLWSKRYGTGGPSNGSGVTTDQSRNVICVGSYSGSVNVDGTALSTLSTQTKDAYIFKYTP